MPTKKAITYDAKKDVVSMDEQFLRDLVARGNVKAPDLDTGETVEKVDDTQALSQLVDDKKEEAKEKKDNKQSDQSLNAALSRGEKAAQRQRRLHERAKELEAANLEREQEQAAKDEQDRLAREEAERQARATDIRSKIEGGVRNVGNATQPLIDKAATIRTVGGIGLLLAILALLLFAVVQVNAQGDTRLKQFWYMLNGRATLSGRVSIVPGSQQQGSQGLTPGPGGTLLGPGIQLPRPDGTCPPGYHQIRGSAGNLLCQRDGTGGGPELSVPLNGSYRSYTTSF